MWPDQQQQTEYPIDYLNQISPVAQKSAGPSPKLLLIAIITCVVVAIGFVILMLTNGSGQSTKLTYKAEELSTRLETMKELVDTNHKNIHDNSLRTQNSTLSIFLSSTMAETKDPLSSIAPNIGKKPTKEITTSEEKLSTDLQAKLDDSQLAGTFDRTYAREIAYQIDLLIGLMNEVYTKTNNDQVHESLEKLSKSIVPIKKAMSTFSADK